MDYKEIEKKWQKVWEDEKRFEVPNHVEGKENKYVLNILDDGNCYFGKLQKEL